MNKKNISKSLIYSTVVFSVIFGSYSVFVKQNFLQDINPYKKIMNHYEKKEYSKLIDMAKKLLIEHPQSINIRRYLWKSYLITEQFENAIFTLNELDKLLPENNIEILYAYCTLYKYMKNYDLAVETCKKALAIKPDNLELKTELAKILIKKSDLNTAYNYILDNFEENSFDKDLLIANIKTLENNYKESIKILEKLRLENPNEYTLYYYLANNYIYLEDYIIASSYLEEFTSNSTNISTTDINLLEDAYNKLAYSYETNKMYSKAYDAYKDASCFSLKLQKTDSAIKMMQKAISLSYINFRGFVSEKDFKEKFNELRKDLESKCGAKLFSFGNFFGD